MNFYLQARYPITEETLIISDEFETNAAASMYRGLLIAALFDRIRFAYFADVSSWIEKALIIEIIQADSHPNIQTKGVDEVLKSIQEDMERVMEFIDHPFSEVSFQAKQVELVTHKYKSRHVCVSTYYP